MNPDDDLLQDSAEDLFEEAPCGYVTTLPDGTIVKVNRTFEAWTGHHRDALVGSRRFKDLLSPGGRIYYETHYAPLLQMQRTVREIAVEIVCTDGTRLPALINSVLHSDARGQPRLIRTTVFDATDRRRYEEELLNAGRREHDIAQELQRSLLSGELPRARGLDIDVAYRSAVSELEIGGDWYDAFWLEDGASVGLVVGDVVGRGITAAATMGQLRSAVRALASIGLSPGPLLEALDHYVRRHGLGQSATVVYAQLSLASGGLCYSCAGHPPPALVAPGEAPRFLWEGRGVPLDVRADGTSRAEASCKMQSGAALLLYTDGLIERRGHSLTEGMERLAREIDEHRDEPAAELTCGLVNALHDPEGADDMCLLAVRWESRGGRAVALGG